MAEEHPFDVWNARLSELKRGGRAERNERETLGDVEGRGFIRTSAGKRVDQSNKTRVSAL